MYQNSRFCSIAVPLFFAVASVAPCQAAPEDTETEIASWIKQLDADRFLDREEAVDQLVKSGVDAIEPVSTVVKSGNREVVTRGVDVLRRLALANDVDVQIAAEDALAALAVDNESPAGRRAKTTLGELAKLWQPKAEANLRNLGARIHTPQQEIGRQLTGYVRTITIDEEFKGKVTDLRNLRWLKDVEQIHLAGEKVGDDWLPFIPAMPKVSFLVIQETKVTAAGIEHLKPIQRLQRLSVLYSPVDDKAIPTLKTLTNTLEMRLYGTKITRAGADKLKTALAGTRIDFRGGAFLGVQCALGATECVIQFVQPNSAAAKAELKSGDVIVNYDGTDVDSFEALVELIGKNQPGAEVTVVVRRGEEKVSRKVTLGGWGR